MVFRSLIFILYVGAVTLFLITNTYASGHSPYTYVPEKAKEYIPLLKKEIDKTLPDFKEPYYFGGLIEQESCVSLTSSRCWDPKSRLKTSREEGAGLGQLTRAYNSNGTLRFDSLKDIRLKYMNDLRDLTWKNIYYRPDLQIKSLLLLWNENYSKLYNITGPKNRIMFADAAYNGGLRGVYNDQRLCSLTKGCNYQYWFGNVEKTCTKSKRILYGNKNACDINREHVYNVIKIRMDKYKPYFEDSN